MIKTLGKRKKRRYRHYQYLLTLFLTGCASASRQIINAQVSARAPAVALAVFEECLLSHGVRLSDIKNGQVRFSSQMDFENSNGSLNLKKVRFSSDNQSVALEIVTKCQDTTRITFNELVLVVPHDFPGAIAVAGDFFPPSNFMERADDKIVSKKVEVTRISSTERSGGEYLLKYYSKDTTATQLVARKAKL